MTDLMMKDIIENFKSGGAVKGLADYYNKCVESVSILA